MEEMPNPNPLLTKIQESDIKQQFLANFCDGDTWEEADAVSFTKHGGLDIAEYFYNLANIALLEEIIKDLKESKPSWARKGLEGENELKIYHQHVISVREFIDIKVEFYQSTIKELKND